MFVDFCRSIYHLLFHLDTCKKQNIQFSFLLQIVETLYSSKGNPNCLGGKNDILGRKALVWTIGLCVDASDDDESGMENEP